MSVFPKKFDNPYKGEKFVWEKFNEYLPKEYISYHNYTIGLKEADVILLCPNKGILIIEIKGYLAKNIINVPDNETIIRKNNPPDLSPYKQARNYMHLMNSLLEENGLNEVYVVPTVAYPFIKNDEFIEKGLDKISNQKITFTEEDFQSFAIFSKKVEEIFELAYEQFNRPTLVKNCFNSLNFDRVRRLFEGENYLEKEDEVEVDFPQKSEEDLFSRLVYVNNINDMPMQYYRSLVDDIFAGVEVYFYTPDSRLMDSIKKGIVTKLDERGLLNNKEFIKNGELKPNHFYNLEVCSLNSNTFEIKNGDIGEYRTILEELDNKTNFNLNQYEIEHAPSEDIIVSAGAGTGKTYSLISRINYLIWRHGYTPEELAKKIVMITFTNEAADSMKKKIQEFFLNKQLLTKDIKVFRYFECIEDMKISTIHSLSKMILKKYAILMGLGTDYKIITGTHVKENIVKNAVNKYFKQKNISYTQLNLPNYRLVKRILSLISKLDNKNIDVILDGSKFGEVSGAENKIYNKLFIDVISEYQTEIKKYQRDNNCIFLSELIKSLKNLISWKNSKKQVFDKFSTLEIDYLIVDEFQDTDDIQIEIMCQFAELFKFNFFVVGDIKQCIYRFRGAEVKAFDTLRKIRTNSTKSSILTFTLNKNYRTDKEVLNKFNDIFTIWDRKNCLVYTDKDRLTSNMQFDSTGIFELVGRPQDSLITLLKDIIKAKKKETTAILVRYNWQIDEIKQLCNANKIAVETDVGGELFKIDPTVDFYKLVQALRYSKNEEYIYNLYTTAYVSSTLPKKYLMKLTKEDYDLVDYFNVNPPINNWNKYVVDMRQNPVLKVLRELVNEVKPWDNAANKDFIPEDEKEHIRNSYMKNVDELFENLLDKSNSDYLTINNISNYLEVMIMTSQEELARAPYHRKSEGNNIICTTVHKAKGLEYDNVILPYCEFNISYKKPKGDVDVIVSDNKIGYSVKLTDSPIGPSFQNNYRKKFESDEYKDRREEETRILYVAMTRTVKRLYYMVDVLKFKDSWGNLIRGV